MTNDPSLDKYPKIKFSNKLKDENWGSAKGQAFLFIVVANELGLAADYVGMKTDYGVKEKIQYFNDKLDSIINKNTGNYWDDDYAGTESVIEKAKIAKPFLAVANPTFTQEVADLLDEVLKSHVPATSGAVIKDEPQEIVIPETVNDPTFANVGESAGQLRKRIERENAERELGEGNLKLAESLFEGEIDSDLEEEEEEDDDETINESFIEKSNIRLASFLDEEGETELKKTI